MPKFSIKERLMSFSYAFDGLKVLMKDEHNAWVHLSIAVLAVTGGFYFGISDMEWITVVICIGAVFSAEIFNTSIEHISNFIQPEKDIRIKAIKDLAAAGVVITALASLIVGLIIFIPRIIDILQL